MHLEVSSPIVIRNLEKFKQSLSYRTGPKTETREYKVFLDCRTGEMSFVKKIGEEVFTSPRGKDSVPEMRPLTVIVSESSGKNHFDVHIEIKHQLKALGKKGVDGVALRIARETIEILNEKMKDLPFTGGLPEKAALEDLSSIQVRQEEMVEMHPNWAGLITAEQAEERLKKEKVGAFLIRSLDENLSLMVENLAEIHHCSIEGYSLVYVAEKEKKFPEKMILHVSWGNDRRWLVYNDETILTSEIYHKNLTLQELLEGFEDVKLKVASR